MKKLIALLLTIGIAGCASMYSPMYHYNNLSGLFKAKAVAVNSNNQLTGGWGISTGSSLINARSNAISRCKQSNSQFVCVIEWENNNYVLTKSLTSLRQQNQKQYLAAKQNICRGYGFKESNAIATCVQNEINNDKIYQNAQNVQKSQSRSYNWNALSELGASLSNSANNGTYIQPQATQPSRRTYLYVRDYMNGMNRVCIYDGWTQTMNGATLCPLSIQR
jgi:hypothetical protein